MGLEESSAFVLTNAMIPSPMTKRLYRNRKNVISLNTHRFVSKLFLNIIFFPRFTRTRVLAIRYECHKWGIHTYIKCSYTLMEDG